MAADTQTARPLTLREIDLKSIRSGMPAEKILLILSDPEVGLQLERVVFQPAGYEVTLASRLPNIETLLEKDPQDLVIIGDPLDYGDSLELATRLMANDPVLPIILISNNPSRERVIAALRVGVSDILSSAASPDEILQSVARAHKRRKGWDTWAKNRARRDTLSLHQRLLGLEAIQRIGRKITASLDVDSVLRAVVDSAVELTNAEEGSLLLLDEPSGELYMRAAQNFQEDFVQTFRLPITNTLAGDVIRTAQPVLINEDTPLKIKASYLVHTLIYVPLIVKERAIGVLGVDNRQPGHSFNEYHIALLSTLAEYAAIAIDNAYLYSWTEIERHKFETILTKIEEGVIIMDPEDRVILINRRARLAFDLEEDGLIGKHIQDVLKNSDLREYLDQDKKHHLSHLEVTLENGQVMNAQLTPIPEVGLAITMQDITHLKELDRIKSDFVNTVSHDLRSPLTAILGYVELIDRVGPVTPQQSDFIRRVEVNVHNITALINDLLDLGRIEAGFDALKELVPLATLIDYTIDGIRGRATEKQHELICELDDDLPLVLGNPVQLRQMLGNLIGNAVKYTQPGGRIEVRAHSQDEQIFLQISDNGPGIPLTDQPYIFDKFYRGSNITGDIPGTGLGLAIVKSIVESHQGRIWLESSPNKGTTFIVVLPIAPQKAA